MKSIRILSWNVNGIRAIERKGFGGWLAGEGPDILCLQETKAQVDQIPEGLSDDSYEEFFVAAERKGYSGLGLFSRLKPVTVSEGMGLVRFDSEGRVQVADYGGFVLFNVYFPNGKASAERLAYKLDFYDEFLKFVMKVRRKNRNIVICGDVNTAHKEIDLARPKANEKTSGFLPVERAWIDRLLAAGFVDSLRVFDNEPGRYSWWDYKTRARERNVGWRIDYFFVSEGLKKKLKAGFILDEVEGSDHCPVGIELAVAGK